MNEEINNSLVRWEDEGGSTIADSDSSSFYILEDEEFFQLLALLRFLCPEILPKFLRSKLL